MHTEVESPPGASAKELSIPCLVHKPYLEAETSNESALPQSFMLSIQNTIFGLWQGLLGTSRY